MVTQMAMNTEARLSFFYARLDVDSRLAPSVAFCQRLDMTTRKKDNPFVYEESHAANNPVLRSGCMPPRWKDSLASSRSRILTPFAPKRQGTANRSTRLFGCLNAEQTGHHAVRRAMGFCKPPIVRPLSVRLNDIFGNKSSPIRKPMKS